MPVATCKFKPDSKTYDYLFNEADMTLDVDDLVLVESEYAAWGYVVVKVDAIADNEPKWATKRITQKLDVKAP